MTDERRNKYIARDREIRPFTENLQPSRVTIREFLIALGVYFEPVKGISPNQEYKELFLFLNDVRTGTAKGVSF